MIRKPRKQAALSLGVPGIISDNNYYLIQITIFPTSADGRHQGSLCPAFLSQDLPWEDRSNLQDWGWVLLLERSQCRGAGVSVTDEHHAAANNNSS